MFDALNAILLQAARRLDSLASSTALHESYYLYAWIETTHVLTLVLFLGMLVVIDLRMLGLGFRSVPAATLARWLDRPMLIGFAVMVVTGVLLFYAIPVRTTQSLWFRIKVVLLVIAGLNALLLRRYVSDTAQFWEHQGRPPAGVRVSAGASLALWAGVVLCGRAIAYDWFDCHKTLPGLLYKVAGCVDELAALEAAGG